jgi:uncharacterized protein (DUF983 family)
MTRMPTGRHLVKGRKEVQAMSDRGYNPTTNPALTGILGRCPRCQKGSLFKGIFSLALAPRCEVCGLDYSFADPADGPAFFSMTIAAIPALGFALWFQLTFEPPWWAHLFVTLPLTLLACVVLLRPLKGWLVCSQYFHKAEEGSIDRDWHRDAAASRKRDESPLP